MNILVLGAGLMGPTMVKDMVESDEVSKVVIGDVEPANLERCLVKLGQPSKLEAIRVDITHRSAAMELLKGFEVVANALPRELSLAAVEVAIEAGVNLVDLAAPPESQWPRLHRAAQEAGTTIVVGCGVEPGLTDILARHAIERLDRVEEVHIKCGGIPQEPKPPLGYKIVFGGTRLPLHTAKARVVQGGEIKEVERYSGVEPVYFEGVGHPECYQEGFPLHLLELPGMERVKECTEKTVRWPGYSEKINFLRECGFLDTKPLSIGQGEIAPLTFLNALLYPQVRLEEGEKDITVLRVEVIGEREQKRVKYRFEMVDFYDQEGGITSMARTTSYPCAILAPRMR